MELAEVEKLAEMGVVINPQASGSGSGRKGKGKAKAVAGGHVVFADGREACELFDPEVDSEGGEADANSRRIRRCSISLCGRRSRDGRTGSRLGDGRLQGETEEADRRARREARPDARGDGRGVKSEYPRQYQCPPLTLKLHRHTRMY